MRIRTQNAERKTQNGQGDPDGSTEKPSRHNVPSRFWFWFCLWCSVWVWPCNVDQANRQVLSIKVFTSSNNTRTSSHIRHAPPSTPQTQQPLKDQAPHKRTPTPTAPDPPRHPTPRKNIGNRSFFPDLHPIPFSPSRRSSNPSTPILPPTTNEPARQPVSHTAHSTPHIRGGTGAHPRSREAST